MGKKTAAQLDREIAAMGRHGSSSFGERAPTGRLGKEAMVTRDTLTVRLIDLVLVDCYLSESRKHALVEAVDMLNNGVRVGPEVDSAVDIVNREIERASPI